MEYNDKLRLAKEALESGSYDRETIEYIFPELRESEDEKMRKEIIQFLLLPHPQFVGNRNYEKWIDWLEKQGEQKSAWSEEDEENRKNILYILNQLKGTAIYKEDKTAENCIDWLKSLKDRVLPQNTWKPSKEQMNGLKEAIEFLGCTKTRRNQLQSLYEQLKKLREE